jgi:uncharacterized membrane protein (UPF0127 family)
MRTTTLSQVDGSVVVERCSIADSYFSRLRGLLGRDTLPPGEGLLLRPAGSIHTAFMRFPLDTVFLDRDLKVLAITRELPAWRAAWRRGARAVLELPAGECRRRGLEVGDQLELTSPSR